MFHVFEHSLIDSLKVLFFSVIIYVLLSFVEEKISNIFKRHKKTTPVLGALVGLIPQCGISVVAADLYLKQHISMGAIFAVFFACSDEAMPLLFSSPDKTIYVIPLLLFKFIFGFSIGYLVDYIYKKQLTEKEIEEVHVGCCHHEIDHKKSKVKTHLIHPLIHSLKIFIYVFVINFIFGVIIYYIGEENIKSFLSTSKYLSPMFTTLIGLIPNCASSVLVTELFIMEGGIPFGALFSGLCVNSGLGIVYLLKNKNNIKDTIKLISILIISSIVLGYLFIGLSLLSF